MSNTETLPTTPKDDNEITMDARVSQLETHMEYMRETVSEIKALQKEMSKSLADLTMKVDKLPTKDDLWSWKVQWLAIALGTVAFIVGGIIGGLDWIKTR